MVRRKSKRQVPLPARCRLERAERNIPMKKLAENAQVLIDDWWDGETGICSMYATRYPWCVPMEVRLT